VTGAALSGGRLRDLLEGYGDLAIGVVGDFFLDAYLDCDRRLNEPSLETGRNCYQVVRTRRQAGAAGTVAANLVALGVGKVEAVGYCGDDGEGYELRRDMSRMGLEMAGFHTAPDRFTPTYGKPTYVRRDHRRWTVVEELERLDIKNRRATPRALQEKIVEHIVRRLPAWDGVLVVDQVSEANCGVVTTRVRNSLMRAARQHRGVVFLADSRERIASFRHVIIKPNQREAAGTLGTRQARSASSLERQARQLARATGRPVFVTLAEQGILVADSEGAERVPGVSVSGPVDPVGAGDTTSATIVASLAAGATPVEAAVVASLAASLTVQQIGTTGTASPRAIRTRHREVTHGI